ncbi:MAG: (p)ppGpp synthetase, partial [Comamonas sp.]
TRTGFNQSMRTHISTVKDYKKHFELLHPTDAMSPYEVIRHCMYLSDKRSFQHLLGADMRQAFERWLSTQQDAQATA